jgi:hypothetical protein
VSIKANSNWKTMKEMADHLYIDLRSDPPAPIKYIPDRTETNGLAKVRFYDTRMNMFPKDVPLSCLPAEFGQSSSQNQPTTTDLFIIPDSDILKATEPGENTFQYYPLAASEHSNWAVLSGRVEDRDDLVACVWSSAYEYSLEFRHKKVSTRNFIVRTNDVAVKC